MATPAVKKKRLPPQQYYIFIPTMNETPEDAESFVSAFTNPAMVASEFAEYLYQERDGWDWMLPGQPYEVGIVYPGGKIEYQEISYDLEPFFYSTKVGAPKYM